MLTLRQRKLVAFLKNRTDWIKTKEISDFFKVSNKTILKEIKNLNESGSSQLVIEHSQHKGYRIAFLSDEVKEVLVDDKLESEVSNTLKDRPTQFILFLIFNNRFVSMQEIAESFYVSKTVVAKEFDTIKRWINRNKGLELEVSNLGCKINGDERYKRMYISNIITLERMKQLPLEKSFSIQYRAYISKISAAMTRFVIDNAYQISDADFNRICRYIATSIVRSKSGYSLKIHQNKTNQNKRTLDIVQLVKDATNYVLTESELLEINNLLEIFNWNEPYSHVDSISRNVGEVLLNIEHLLNVPQSPTKYEQERLTKSMSSLQKKQHYGITTLNSWNNQVVKTHLLAAHFAFQLVSHKLGMAIDKEISRIILLLNMYIEISQLEELNVLIVSKSNREIIDNLDKKMRKNSIWNTINIEYIPKYIFDNDPTVIRHYQMSLTTEDEVMFSFPTFKLIQAIPSDAAILDIFFDHKNTVELKLKEYRNEIISQVIRRKYDESDNVLVLNKLAEFSDDKASSFVVDNNELIVMKIDVLLNSEIEFCTLKKAINYKGESVNKILFISCNENMPNINEFFRAISEMIQTN